MEDRERFDEENPSPARNSSPPGLGRPIASLPVFPSGENTPLLQNTPTDSSGYRAITPSFSFSNTTGINPYTRENKPNRLPFHHPTHPSGRVSSEQDSELYARFRYYSRLRAPAESDDHALVIPDHVVPTELFLFFLPGHLQSDGKQESFITIIAIWNTMMGTSLLTMPWACAQAGFVGGLLIMIVQGILCLYTACKLLNLQITMGLQGEMHELGYLFRFLWPGSLGKAIEGTSVTFSVVTLLGALVVYWVLMSNFLYNTGEAIYQLGWGPVDNSSDSISVVCPPNVTESGLALNLDDSGGKDSFHVFWKQDLSVPLLLLLPFSFLLNIKNTSIFTFFNSFGAVSVFAIYLFVIVKASYWGFNFNLTDPTNPMYVPMFKGTFTALSGTLSLAYFIHNCVITILKGNKHPENNVRDLSIAYVLVMLTYIPVGIIFYLTFPLPKYCIVDNFLDNFPPHHLALAIARCFLLFQMLTVYPLLSFFVRTQFLVYLLGPEAPHSTKQVLGINAAILSISVCFAIFCPNIGFLIRWVGAISGLAYIFVLPAVTNIQAHFNKGSLSVFQVVSGTVLIGLGLANFIAQFFIS